MWWAWQYKLDATGNCYMRMKKWKKWKNTKRRMMVSHNGDGEMATELGRDGIKWDGDRQTENLAWQLVWGNARELEHKGRQAEVGPKEAALYASNE